MAAVARNFHLVDGLLCTRMARFLSKSRFNRYSVKKKSFVLKARWSGTCCGGTIQRQILMLGHQPIEGFPRCSP